MYNQRISWSFFATKISPSATNFAHIGLENVAINGSKCKKCNNKTI